MFDDLDTRQVELAVAGPVAVLRLNRPAARNALSSTLVAGLAGILTELDSDRRVRVAVLTGRAPGFCAGSDLRELAGLSEIEQAWHEMRAGQLARGVQQLGFPVVAAVEGFALGGGFLLATSCDVVVSAVDARWHLPEVGLGWVPPWGLPSLIARAGPAAARRLAWGEQPMSGEALHRLGVVDDLAEPGQALARALAIGARLAELPPHAVASTKAAFAEPLATAAEKLDARSASRFGLDCRSDTARASFARFAQRTSGPSQAGG